MGEEDVSDQEQMAIEEELPVYGELSWSREVTKSEEDELHDHGRAA